MNPLKEPFLHLSPLTSRAQNSDFKHAAGSIDDRLRIGVLSNGNVYMFEEEVLRKPRWLQDTRPTRVGGS